MSKEKKQYIFIILNDDGSLAAGKQIDVDNAIKDAENANEDIEFKVIGRISEPSNGRLPVDFDEKQIEWYEEGEKDKTFIKRAVVAIVNFIS